MTRLDIKNCEVISLVDGDIYVLHSDDRSSVGFLRLNPRSSLAKHNRPVEEWLVQVEGTSIIKLHDDRQVIEEVVLKRGDMLKIPANQYHEHTNLDNVESLTSWHFDGDITQIIEKLRKTGKRSRPACSAKSSSTESGRGFLRDAI